MLFQRDYALESGAWSDAAQLTPRPGNVLYAEAMSYFARALGAARSGHPEAAAADISTLADLRDKLKAIQDSYWSEMVEIGRQIAHAWVAYAGGKKDEALAAMSAVADAEDATEKSAVSPGPLAPARELYGFMLLEANKPREALVAFEASM